MYLSSLILLIQPEQDNCAMADAVLKNTYTYVHLRDNWCSAHIISPKLDHFWNNSILFHAEWLFSVQTGRDHQNNFKIYFSQRGIFKDMKLL